MLILRKMCTVLCTISICCLISPYAIADREEFVKKALEEAKVQCDGKGWVFKQIGDGSSCLPPTVTSQPVGTGATGAVPRMKDFEVIEK